MKWLMARRAKSGEARRLERERLDRFLASSEGQRYLESERDWHKEHGMYGQVL